MVPSIKFGVKTLAEYPVLSREKLLFSSILKPVLNTALISCFSNTFNPIPPESAILTFGVSDLKFK